MSNNLKIRIPNGIVTAIGPGKAELLTLIHQHGSISSAAKHMKMSYRRAWELVNQMNKCFDQAVVVSSVGGSRGGGAQLTEFGIEILATYQSILIKCEEASNKELAFIKLHLISSD